MCGMQSLHLATRCACIAFCTISTPPPQLSSLARPTLCRAIFPPAPYSCWFLTRQRTYAQKYYITAYTFPIFASRYKKCKLSLLVVGKNRNLNDRNQNRWQANESYSNLGIFLLIVFAELLLDIASEIKCFGHRDTNCLSLANFIRLQDKDNKIQKRKDQKMYGKVIKMTKVHRTLLNWKVKDKRGTELNCAIEIMILKIQWKERRTSINKT